jgi:mannose-6-phosphate isomerase
LLFISTIFLDFNRKGLYLQDIDYLTVKMITNHHITMKTSSTEDNCRPWGFYEVLSDQPDHKVKRITVYSGKRLSLQRHQRRSEHWHIVTGNAIMTLDDREIPMQAGDSIDIPQDSLHRIANPGRVDLVFIEIQRGDYFGEDDIERLEDDFGRA